MNGENQPLVTDEPVEFEKSVENQDFKKNTNPFKKIFGIYLNIEREKWRDHNM